jgi:dienelactone hydrolase
MSDDDRMVAGDDEPFGSGIIGVCDVCGKNQAVIILEKERFQLCVIDFLNKSWIGSTAKPGRPLPPYRSERIWFPTQADPQGQAPAILLSPTKVAKRPGILIAPDVYGLTTQLLDAGIRFAREGFEVLLPDVGNVASLGVVEHVTWRMDALFRGGVHVDSRRIRRVAVLYQDALEALRKRPLVDPEKTAVFGVSYGGSLAVTLAGIDRRLGAVVIVSSIPVVPTDYVRLITAPTLALAGARDRSGRRSLEQFGSGKGTRGATTTVYPGVGDLFLARDHRGYKVRTAEAAWTEIAGFLKQTLMPPPPRPPAPPTGPPVAKPPAAAGPSAPVPTPPAAAPPAPAPIPSGPAVVPG